MPQQKQPLKYRPGSTQHPPSTLHAWQQELYGGHAPETCSILQSACTPPLRTNVKQTRATALMRPTAI